MRHWNTTKNISPLYYLLILVVLLGGVMLLLPNQAAEPQAAEPEAATPEAAESEAVETEVSVPTTLTPGEAQEMMQGDELFVLLDVREESEFLELHIPGAILIPLGELYERAPLELSNKQTPIIIYCRSGRRSAEALALLIGLGYEQVFDLGGILNWPYETISIDKR